MMEARLWRNGEIGLAWSRELWDDADATKQEHMKHLRRTHEGFEHVKVRILYYDVSDL